MELNKFFGGTQTVVTSGDAVPISNIPFHCQILTIQAPPSNSGTVYIGGSDVKASKKNGIGLVAGATYGLNPLGGPYVLSDFFIDSTTSGDGISYGGK